MVNVLVFALLTIKRKNFELFMPLMAEQTLVLIKTPKKINKSVDGSNVPFIFLIEQLNV